MQPTSRTLLFLPAILCLPLAAQELTIPWTPGFADVLALAKEKRKVVMIAVNRDGERANEELLRQHYVDPRLAKLGAHTLNVFCSDAKTVRVPGVTPEQQQADDKRVREQVLGLLPEQAVAAPQHVFLRPDGAVLSAVPWHVTKGELEWVWVDAIRKVDPKFEWELSEAARAPCALVYQQVPRIEAERIPTPAQVVEALAEIQKQKMGWANALHHLPALLRSEDPEAIRWVENELRRAPDTHLPQYLSAIGLRSPKIWWKLLEPYVDHRDEDVRAAAIASLEQIAQADALPALARQYRAEQSELIAGRLLRAMATCAPTDKGVRQTITRALEKSDSQRLRMHATIAAGILEDRAAVTASLTTALADESPHVRATAAFVIACRRDAELLQALEQALAREDQEFAREFMKPAVAAVRGGDLDAFEGFLVKVVGDTAPRPTPR